MLQLSSSSSEETDFVIATLADSDFKIIITVDPRLTSLYSLYTFACNALNTASGVDKHACEHVYMLLA